MYQLTVKQHFDAAHYLRDYHGRCENLHGHRYEVAVSVRADALDAVGLAFDFAELKRVLKDRFIARYDHICLNDLSPFTDINPSAENIARTIYDGLRAPLAGTPATLNSVTVWESPDSWCAYSEE